MKHLGAALAFLLVCGCGNETSEALEEAAEQSSPAAADVLQNRSEALEDKDVEAPLNAPGSPAQDAMQDAANASAVAIPDNRQKSAP